MWTVAQHSTQHNTFSLDRSTLSHIHQPKALLGTDDAILLLLILCICICIYICIGIGMLLSCRWDRQPYVSTFGDAPDGKPTAHMLPRNISRNFLVANYGGSNGAIDNDDESLRYENNHNFQVSHQSPATGHQSPVTAPHQSTPQHTNCTVRNAVEEG